MVAFRGAGRLFWVQVTTWTVRSTGIILADEVTLTAHDSGSWKSCESTQEAVPSRPGGDGFALSTMLLLTSLRCPHCALGVVDAADRWRPAQLAIELVTPVRGERLSLPAFPPDDLKPVHTESVRDFVLGQSMSSA